MNTNNSRKIQKHSSKNYFFSGGKVNMPKAKVRKIFKVKKKTIKDDKNNFVIRFKNLSKVEEKDLRSDLDVFISGYFDYEKEDKQE